jgi:uncharacterized membrane protein
VSNTGVTPTASGVSFTSLLLILFIGLRLTEHINWSWWWVLSPLWIPMGFAMLIVAVILAHCLISAWRDRRMKLPPIGSAKWN